MTATADTSVEYGRCARCDALMLPVPTMAPCGHDEAVVRARLDETGTVYSWTRVYVGDKTRIMVMADFLGDALRVTAPLDGADHVAIDQGVRLIVSSGDTPYVFRPAE